MTPQPSDSVPSSSAQQQQQQWGYPGYGYHCHRYFHNGRWIRICRW